MAIGNKNEQAFYPAPFHLTNNLICFTTMRHWGVSQGAYAHFNMGAHVEDSHSCVQQNRQLLAQLLATERNKISSSSSNIAQIKWLNQQHTNNVVSYESATQLAADGLYCDTANTPLAIMTADCLPIVLFSKQSKEICALHAGWKGLVSNIISAGAQKLCGSQLEAWIGPAICQEHFEVGADLLDSFVDYPSAIVKGSKPDKYLLDLPAIAEQQLLHCGVENVYRSDVCTYSNQSFFSHRQASHAGLLHTGRMATLVMRTD